MSDVPANMKWLLHTADNVCEECATPDDLAQLDAMLFADDASRRHYLNYCRMHITLAAQLRAQCATEKLCRHIDLQSDSVGPEATSCGSPSLPAAAFNPGAPVSFTIAHSILSSGWPVAYLVATVVLAIGALIGSVIYVSHPSQIARQSETLPSPLSPLPSVVGQVTGMVDCKWKERTGDRKVAGGQWPVASEEKTHRSQVVLGDTFHLAAGLLEITYRTGAKVILQGPATYVVDAKDGGFLSVGKLTALVEKRDGERGTGDGKVGSGQWTVGSDNLPSAIRHSPSSNPSLATSHQPLFTINTPTAIVTDLGTEFGVEVDEKGTTTSHVFRGSVNVRPVHGDKKAQTDDIVLRANESVRTERDSGDSQRVIVRRVVVKSDGFVRRLQESSSPSVDVLAWFRMGEDEPNARAGEAADAEIHSHHKARVRLERHGSPTYSADTEAPGSSLSMTFHSDNNGECFRTSRFPFVPNDYFILEAWVKPHKLGADFQMVVASGRGSQNGYCLTVMDGRWYGVIEGAAWLDSEVVCEVDEWTHLALVCERGKSQLWINGVPVGKVIDKLPIMPDGRFTIGGSPDNPQIVFNGEIDEVRLSTFIGPFRPEMLLLRKPHPSQ